MGWIARSAVAAIIAIAVLLVASLPIDWDAISWGNVPEWIGAVALVSLAGGVWRIADHRTNTPAPRHRKREFSNGTAHSIR